METLEKIRGISAKVITHTDDLMPEALYGRDMACRYYGQVREKVAEYGSNIETPATEISVQIVDRIVPHIIRDWRKNHAAINKLLTRCQPDWRKRKAYLDRVRLS